MKNITKVLAIGTVLLAVGGIGVAAMAETTGPGCGPRFMHGHRGQGMMGMHGGARGHRFGDSAARLAALKTELGIKPEQAGAWDAYAKVVQDTATQMRASHDKIDPDTVHAMPLKDRIAVMTTQMELRDKASTTVKAAANTLLASLDDAQKAKAQTSLPGLAARGPGGMRHAGERMIHHGMGTMTGPTDGVTR